MLPPVQRTSGTLLPDLEETVSAPPPWPVAGKGTAAKELDLVEGLLLRMALRLFTGRCSYLFIITFQD